MRDYKTLQVWEKSHELVKSVYAVCAKFPKEELYALTSQMKRSATSIPTNIVEGCGRRTDKDFCRFLYIAFGSANELEYQIMLSAELKFIDTTESQHLSEKIEEIKKMLSSLIRKINS
ncbi:four helix bundle protein [Flavobacterium sp.]|uniref:four helix bundle protein n=1 Tax=Flavobacterium sp. TaxID=239 RepID=UPI00262360EE|nr:four helix bundle protein [Flavobacterium sp.]